MSDPISLIGIWLQNLLIGLGLPSGIVVIILIILAIALLGTILLLIDIGLVWVERKIVARFQDRLGPNRLGPFGLIQPVADVLKLVLKEDITPKGADRFIYNLAPVIALATVMLLWAVIPFTSTILGSDLNVGILYLVAIGAISTLGIIMAGWASNNKYALLGAIRTVAQMVSYEVPMVIVLLIPVLLARSMSVQQIVQEQSLWYLFLAPIAAIIFLITSIAELGRAPFDLLEAESEIVAGFHIEYTGMKFGLFYAGELLHALTVGALFSTLFLGGWRGPFSDQIPILGVFYLFAKAFIVYFIIMWVRYTVPRIRIDHMLNFNWKFLTPIALVVLIVTALVDKILVDQSTFVYAAGMLIVNVIVAWITLVILRTYAQTKRMRVGEDRPVARPELASTIPTSASASHSGN